MPPQGEKNIGPEAVPQVATPEVPKGVEVPVVSEAPKEPAKETFGDQPVTNTLVQEPSQAATPTPIPQPQNDESEVSEMDNAWVGAVEHVIENNENKPYEEEEEAEKLQIKYLFKKFGKLLKKDKSK